uniref:Uncharacterized protein n=1 Tax=Acrobeloides nanus TaxID=290746 RepID=A0A914CE40_9BILA
MKPVGEFRRRTKSSTKSISEDTFNIEDIPPIAKKIEDGTYQPPVLKPAKKHYFPQKNPKRIVAGKKAAEKRRTKSESSK